MNPVTETLSKIYTLLDQVGEPLSPELVTIRHIFANMQKILLFEDNELYLQYIKVLINERYNISFPEDPAVYATFFEDCLTLKRQMKERAHTYVKTPGDENVWDRDAYLSLVRKLFSQLKTPYYTYYCKMVFAFQQCFKNANTFDKTLQDFYSVMIKSSPEKNHLIGQIASHAGSYASYIDDGYMGEAFVSALLVHQLGMILSPFGGQQTAILSVLKKDDHYINTLSPTEKKSAFANLPEYLARREAYFAKKTGLPMEKEAMAPGIHGSDHFVHSEFLNTYAYNMNAVDYKCNPAICREQELLDLALILISPKKSPILIGDAGTGKTSIVEGLAWQIQRGLVPDLLKDKKLFKLTTSSLLGGCKYVGEMEERMKKLTDELAQHPEVILFIDEIHTIVGAGSTESSNNDISNMLKPFIDRGAIKVIGATTRKEYEAYMLPDRALARRFYPIAVNEPDPAMTLEILLGNIPAIEHETHVLCTFAREETRSLLQKLIAISHPDHQPIGQETRLPELPLTLLEMAFSYAALDSRTELLVQDLDMAILHSNLLSSQFRQNFGGILAAK